MRATTSDRADVSGLEVIKFVNSPVTGPVTISGVTVYSTPAQAIKDAILDAEQERESAKRDEALWFRTVYLSVSSYTDVFRTLVGDTFDDSDVPEMLEFLKRFREMQLKSRHPNWREIVEALTLNGTLAHLYGQHLQITDLKRRNDAGRPFSTPIDLYRARSDLVATNADQGHFKKAAAHLGEALKFSDEQLGPHDQHSVFLLFETALLHRNRGEYRVAAAIFQKLLTELSRHHSSEKRWISASYKNLAIVERESNRNVLALYHLWAADAFEVASELDQSQTKTLMKQQKKHFIAYTGFQALLALPLFLLAGLFLDQTTYRAIAAGVITAVLYPYYLAYFDGIFGILVARWALGPFANQWPATSPLGLVTVQSASLQYRALRSHEPIP